MNFIIVGEFSPESMAKLLSDNIDEMSINVSRISARWRWRYIGHSKFLWLLSKVINRLYSILDLIRLNQVRVLRSINNKLEILDKNIIISTHDFLNEYQISSLRSMNKTKDISFVLYFPDAISNIGNSKFMTSGYDHMFFKDKTWVDNLINEYSMKNVEYLPEAYSPLHHKKVEPKPDYKYDILFFGNPHSYRLRLISILKEQFNVEYYGGLINYKSNRKKNIYLHGKEKVRMVNSSRININVFHPAEGNGLNVRFFEIAGMGGFQLTSYREEIIRLFPKQLEACVKDTIELKNKINYFINNPKYAEQIAEANREEVLKNHTYRNRIEYIIKICN